LSALFDPGLQPERTELAWRRTALALGVGSIVAMRLLPETFDNAWWALVGVTGLIVAATLWVSARERYRQVDDILRRAGDRAPMPGAALLTALAFFSTGIGIVSVAIVLRVAGSAG
jgi:uncharacterized membrane protein YidH (DUF202 family)